MLFEIIGAIVAVFALYYVYFAWIKADDEPVPLHADDMFQAVDNRRTRTESADALTPDSHTEHMTPMTIYFGSQTGTAESYARTLRTEGTRAGFLCSVSDLEKFDVTELRRQRLVCFVMATYGEGDPTDNAVSFMQWLRQAAESDSRVLEGVSFTVFGLGNRQYQHYNRMGRDVNKLLEKMGGNRAFPYGEGDDDASLERDFEAWKEGLWAALAQQFLSGTAAAAAAAAASSTAPPPQPDCPYDAVPLSVAPGDEPPQDCAPPLQSVALTSRPYFEAVPVRMLARRQLRRDCCDGSTLHLELDFAAAGLSYRYADNVGICPENDPALVEAVARECGVPLDQWFTLLPLEGGEASPPFPTPCTARMALARYCDLTSPARKPFVTVLAYAASEPEERAKLMHLVSKAGREEFQRFVVEEHRTALHLLRAFPSARPALAPLLLSLPRLVPRYYTLCSSARLHPGVAHVVASLVTEPRPRGEVHQGVCTHFLDRCAVGEQGRFGHAADDAVAGRVRVFVRPSTFKLPPSPTLPIVMVGPGTGVAPMRAFLQERAALRRQGAHLGPAALFFGCRRREADFIYEEDLRELQRQGALCALHVACSRDGPSKEYVQHLLLREGAQVWEMLERGRGSLYVCGGTKMGDDVHSAVQRLAVEQGGLGAAEAAAWVERLQQQHRYVQELWS